MRLSLRPVVVAFVLVTGAGCYENLQHNLAEQDANDIMVLLQESGVGAKKVREEGGTEPTFLVQVSRGDYAQAAKLLRENSLPRTRSKGLGIFAATKGMIPTQTEERAMYQDALAGEVQNALTAIPGVLEARTIVMIPETTDLTQPENRPLPSASVMVKYRTPGDGAPPLPVESIQKFVAGVVPDLKPEHVNVLMTQAQMPAAMQANERFRSVLGITLAAESEAQFKWMVAIGGFVVLALSALMAFFLLRGGSGAVRDEG